MTILDSRQLKRVLTLHLLQVPTLSFSAQAMMNMLNMAVLLSANLGVMNLLPIPALDGGRLVFLVVEAIRRKPVNRDLEGSIHFAGLMLLMALMVVVMYHDILKMF